MSARRSTFSTWTRRILPAAIAVGALWLPASARAQGASDSDERATALVLFDEGRKLMAAGRYDQACPRLAESLRLVPGSGTRFNLAECYERSGKIASAWLLYREVAAEMARAQDAAREKASSSRMKALEARLSKLQIDVPERIAGLTVSRNGRPVTDVLWGTPVPVDPGTYTLRVEAPGYRPRTYEVQVAREGETFHVQVEPLVRRPAYSAAAAVEVEDSDAAGGSALATAGWATFGVGLGVTAVGCVLIGVGHSKYAAATEECPDPNNCANRDVIDDGNTGRNIEGGGIIVTSFGGPAVLTGIIMLAVSAMDAAPEEAPADGSMSEQDASAGRARLSASLGPTSIQLRLDW